MPIKQSLNERLARLRVRFGRRRINMLGLLAIAGLASLVIQAFIGAGLGYTSMVYVAVPYGVAVLITLLRPYQEQTRWWQQYTSHAVSALVVMLASSIVLFEGFICVLFLMPIYFLIVTLEFILGWTTATRDQRSGKINSSIVPVLILLLSMEGTSELTTFDRRNTASATATTVAPPQAVLNNLAKGFELPQSNHWLLGVFPMPHTIEAGSLVPGDVHRVHSRYHRWFFTNTHEGEIQLRIDSVSPERVTASFIRDTSYFSTYVKLIGSEILISTDAQGLTHVSLTVNYERRLDPFWYFQPIQQYAIKTMAAHLIQEIMIRD